MYVWMYGMYVCINLTNYTVDYASSFLFECSQREEGYPRNDSQELGYCHVVVFPVYKKDGDTMRCEDRRQLIVCSSEPVRNRMVVEECSSWWW